MTARRLSRFPCPVDATIGPPQNLKGFAMDDSRRRFVSARSAMGTLAGISAADVHALPAVPRGPI